MTPVYLATPRVKKPRLLDLFCGAGGCTRGYMEAGFYVVGVDREPQPNYCGDRFVRADALEILADWEWVNNWYGPFSAITASPPCQAYSAMSGCRPGLADEYPDLVAPVRELLIDTGLPYVIENVPGAPLKDPVVLCGQMFDLELYRHRPFETNWELTAPAHPEHVVPASRAGHWVEGTVMSVSGHIAPIAHARKIMGIDWTTREELAEAIPPAYTNHVGTQLLAALSAATPKEEK